MQGQQQLNKEGNHNCLNSIDADGQDITFIYKQGMNASLVPTNVTKVIFNACVIEIPDGLFSHCIRIEEVHFNDTLKRIGKDAFFRSKLLKRIKLPSKLTHVGEGAFIFCNNLNSISFNEGLTSIDKSAFHCTNIHYICLPSSITQLGTNAFGNCANLSHIDLSRCQGLKRIDNYLFNGCMSLERIELPSSIIKVGENAFCACTSLRRIKLNNGLQKIDEGAFSSCESLEEIQLPLTVTEVGYNAFYACSNLKLITMNKHLKKIGWAAFEDCTKLTQIVMNEGQKKIEAANFWGCASLQCFELPSSVIELGAGAFEGCTMLRNVNFHEDVRTINKGRYIFSDCPSLEFVKFPSLANRIRSLIMVGETSSVEKVRVHQQFQWIDGEFLVPPRCFQYDNWNETRCSLDRVLTWISYYEIRDAATVVELAFQKTGLLSKGAETNNTDNEKEVPGPVRDLIVKYLTPTNQNKI